MNSYSNAGYENSNSEFEEQRNSGSNLSSKKASSKNSHASNPQSQASSTVLIHLSNSSCHSKGRKRHSKEQNVDSYTGSSYHIQLNPIESSYTEDVSYSDNKKFEEREASINQSEEGNNEYTYTYYSEGNGNQTGDSEYTYTYTEPSGDYSRTGNESSLYTYTYEQSNLSNDSDEYTFTYDEPNTEERLLFDAMQNKAEKKEEMKQPIDKVQTKDVALQEPTQNRKQPPKSPKEKAPTRRQQKIMEKIEKLTNNLNELQSTMENSQIEQRKNTKVGKLKNKLANLTGWKLPTEDSSLTSDYFTDDRSYSYTFEYESEVFKKLKKLKPQLVIQSPTEGVVSITNEDENRPKLDLDISPILDAESQDVIRQEKMKQLQEIQEIQERLKELQKNLSPTDVAPVTETPVVVEREVVPPVNKVKKHIRVPKDEKEKIMNKQHPKLKKIHRRVRVEKKKNTDLVNQPPLSPQNEKIQKLIEQQEKIVQQQQEYIEQQEKKVNSSELNESEVAHLSPVKARQVSANNFHKPKDEALPLLEESSSDDSPLTSQSGLQLLDEGSSDENSVSVPTLNVSIVAVEKIPDVDVFCVAYIDNTNEARKTRTIPQGEEKTFNETFDIPCPNEKNKLILLVKKQDLIKEDKLLGVLKIEINPAAFAGNKSINKWIPLSSENGVQTQSRIHIILNMKNPTLNKQVKKSSESEFGTGVFVLQPPNQMYKSSSEARNSLNNNELESTSFFKDLLDDKNAFKKPTLAEQEKLNAEDQKKNYSEDSKSSKKKRSIKKLDATNRDVELSQNGKNSEHSSLSNSKEQAIESVSSKRNNFNSELDKPVDEAKGNSSSNRKNSSASQNKVNNDSDNFSVGFSSIELKMDGERNSHIFKSSSNMK